MKVIWSPKAVQDRLAIWEYLVSENPQAAIDMDERFAVSAGRLASHPMLSTMADTRIILNADNQSLSQGIKNRFNALDF